MKICPTCRTQYTDDTLAFCLQDGTRLVSAETAPAAEAATETVTVVRPADRSSEVTRVPVTAAPAQRSRGPAFAVLLVVLLVFLLIIGAVGAWLIFRHPSSAKNDNIGRNSATINSNSNAPVFSATRSPSASPSPSPPSPSPVPTANTADVQRAVTGRIGEWKSATESLNINAVMQNYAGTIDYYKRGPTSAAVVRADKLRALSMYDSIQINVSNINVSTDAAGEHATAEFDKEWVFQGAKTSRGMVRSQFRLAVAGGKWLIIAEKDLRVYYLN